MPIQQLPKLLDRHGSRRLAGEYRSPAGKRKHTTRFLANRDDTQSLLSSAVSYCDTMVTSDKLAYLQTKRSSNGYAHLCAVGIPLPPVLLRVLPRNHGDRARVPQYRRGRNRQTISLRIIRRPPRRVATASNFSCFLSFCMQSYELFS